MSMTFLLPRTSQAMAFHDATNERVARPPSPTPYAKLPSSSASCSSLLPSPSFSPQSQWTKRKPIPSPLSSLPSPSSSPPPSTTRSTRQFLSPPSRKSAPTCTISLALACASSSLDPSVSPLSSVPVQVPGVVNVVPFPSDESEGVTFPSGEGVAFPTSNDGVGMKRSPSRSPPTHALLRASTSPPLSAAVPHKRVRIAASVTSPSARPSSSGSSGTPKLRRKRSGPKLDSGDKEKEKEKAAVRPPSKEKEGREESPRKKARKSSFPPSSGRREKMRASTPPPLSMEDLPPPYSSMDSVDSTSSMNASSSTAFSSPTAIPSSSSPDAPCSSLPSTSSSSSTSAQLVVPSPTSSSPSTSSSPQPQSPSPQPHQPSPSKLKKAAAADLKLQASVYRSIAWGLQLRQAEAVRLVRGQGQRMTPEAPAETSAATVSSSLGSSRVELSAACTGGEVSRAEHSASTPIHALVDEDISMVDGSGEVCEADAEEEDDGDLHDLYDMYSSRSPIACDATSSPNGFESSSPCCSSFPQSQLLALQDRLLAARLRSYLIMQGVRWELLEVPSLPSPSYSDADVDPFLRDVAEDDKAMEEVPIDMDMDVDTPLPTSDLRSTSSPPPSPPPTYTTSGGRPPARIPTPPEAVAALWMRVASRPRGRVSVVGGRSPLRLGWVPASSS